MFNTTMSPSRALFHPSFNTKIDVYIDIKQHDCSSSQFNMHHSHIKMLQTMYNQTSPFPMNRSIVTQNIVTYQTGIQVTPE